MAYSNGRIYIDKSVTPNAGVSIGDLQQAFGTVISTTVNGRTVRRLSSDLGVIIAKKQGETFGADLVEDGVVTKANATWRVESRREINPWARYRPIPCSLNPTGNNVPYMITPSQRQEERYGIDPPVDMFTADDDLAYTNYANGIEKSGAYFIRLRPWGDTLWKRLTDFVKTEEDGTTTSLGYDHNAKPDEVTVTLKSGKSYAIQPLIPEGQRTIYIAAGSTSARYHLPNDHLWLDEYYKWVRKETSDVTSVNAPHEEWLSPIDLMGTSTYTGRSYASVRRRILIFHWADSQLRMEGDAYYNEADAKWRFYGMATDKVGGSAEYRPFATNKGAWLDLTDSEQAVNTRMHITGTSMGTLSGRCLFIDAWVEEGSSVNVMPIVGFAYEVTITRETAPDDIDVEGIVEFIGAVAMSVGRGDIVYLRFRFLTSELDTYSTPRGVLNAYYDMLAAVTDVNNPGLNVATDVLRVASAEQDGAADGFTYCRVAVGVANDDYDADTEPDWTVAVSVRRKSATTTYSRVFVIDRSSLSV